VVDVAVGLFDEQPARKTAGRRMSGITTHRADSPAPAPFKS
jgi:hypothetical protein